MALQQVSPVLVPCGINTRWLRLATERAGIIPQHGFTDRSGQAYITSRIATSMTMPHRLMALGLLTTSLLITFSAGSGPHSRISCADSRISLVKPVNMRICSKTRSVIGNMGNEPRQWVPGHYFWFDDPDDHCRVYMWSETQTTSFFPASDIQHTMDLILQYCDDRPSTDGRHGGFTHLRLGHQLSLDWIVSVYGPGYIPPGYGENSTHDKIFRLTDAIDAA